MPNSKPIQRMTLRDPAGQLFKANDRLYRVVNEGFSPQSREFLNSKFFSRSSEECVFPKTEWLSAEESQVVLKQLEPLIIHRGEAGFEVMSHELLPFVSYPHEWPPEMLCDAGYLTLELAKKGVKAGWTLKDATPLNVVFRGTQPVFVDLLSFEKRNPQESSWMPYAQFVRNFINPLIAMRCAGFEPATLLASHRDGLEPEEIYPLLSFLQKWFPPYLQTVTLPVLLQRSSKKKSLGMDPSLYKPRTVKNPEQAEFIVTSLMGQLSKTLRRFAGDSDRDSHWANYMSSDYSFTQEQLLEKERIVKGYIEKTSPKYLMDLGCNTGHFSRIASQLGAEVVAVDSDSAAIGQVYRAAKKSKDNILPMLVNISRPTPALGWRNQECASFLDRMNGKFDVVMMLAVIHHMMVTDGIPLSEILELARGFTKEWLIMEFMDFEDGAFRNLCRGRDYSFFTQSHFEWEVRKTFQIVDSQKLTGSHRTVYLLKKNS